MEQEGRQWHAVCSYCSHSLLNFCTHKTQGEHKRYFTAHVQSAFEIRSFSSLQIIYNNSTAEKGQWKMSPAHNWLPLSSRCLRRASCSSPVAPAVSSIPTSAHSCTSFSISGSARGALNFAHGFGSSDFGVSNFGPTILGFAGAYTFGYAMF